MRTIVEGRLKLAVVSSCLFLLSACGGGSGSPGSDASANPPSVPLSVGGTINGVIAGNQVVVNNNADSLTLTANGSFTFDKQVASGAPYDVTVNSPSQPCISMFASGVVSAANVSNVQVICGPKEQAAFHAQGSMTASTVAMYALPDGSAVALGYAYYESSAPNLPFEKYNPANGSWTALNLTPVMVIGLAKLANGTILISTGTATVVFDPVAMTISAPNPFASLTYVPYLTPLLDGRVLASDGVNGIEILDPVTGKWSTGPSMIVNHGGSPAFTVLASGKVLVSGGAKSLNDGTEGWVAITNSEVFDPVAGTWTAVGALATPRFSHNAILLPSGKVLAVLGETGSVNRLCECSYESIGTAELFDPVSATWSSAGSLATAREGATVTLMPTGKVLVTGGDVPIFASPPVGMPTVLASTEIYDPQSNSWSAWGSLQNARMQHSAVLLNSGELLIAGGWTAIPQSTTPPYAEWSTQAVLQTELGW